MKLQTAKEKIEYYLNSICCLNPGFEIEVSTNLVTNNVKTIEEYLLHKKENEKVYRLVVIKMPKDPNIPYCIGKRVDLLYKDIPPEITVVRHDIYLTVKSVHKILNKISYDVPQTFIRKAGNCLIHKYKLRIWYDTFSRTANLITKTGFKFNAKVIKNKSILKDIKKRYGVVVKAKKSIGYGSGPFIFVTFKDPEKAYVTLQLEGYNLEEYDY